MASSNHRAALLSNLRTGGVRGVSQPHSAAPTTTRFHDEGSAQDQELIAMMNNLQMAQLANNNGPMTAGVDGNLRLQQQQQLQLMQLMQQAQAQQAFAQRMFASGNISAEQAQAAQLQLEMVKMQAMHAQQQQNFQNQLLLQQQLLAQNQVPGNAPARRASSVHPPSTAGPLQSEFDQSGLSASQTRTSVAAQLRARAIGRETNLANAVLADEQPAPLSAAPSGRFNTRAASVGVGSGLNPNAASFVGRFSPAPEAINPLLDGPGQVPAWGATGVISGGTSLGRDSHPNSGATTPSQSYNGFSGYSSGNNGPVAPSKSDTAISWRRGSAAVATSNGSNHASSTTSPLPSRSGSASPPGRRSPLSSPHLSPPAPHKSLSLNANVPPVESTPSALKSRPSPLQLKTPSPVISANTSEMVIELESDNEEEPVVGGGSGSASNKSSPTSSTPPSSAASNGAAREEASKKLYEGLGLGRPVASPVNASFGMAINANGASHAPKLLPVGANGSGAAVFTPMMSAHPQQTAYTANIFSPTAAGGFPLHGFLPQVQARVVSEQPRTMSVSVTRQPRGPPSGVDELGARNFASRNRRKAFGGVAAVLEGAAERREAAAEVIAF